MKKTPILTFVKVKAVCFLLLGGSGFIRADVLPSAPEDTFSTGSPAGPENEKTSVGTLGNTEPEKAHEKETQAVSTIKDTIPSQPPEHSRTPKGALTSTTAQKPEIDPDDPVIGQEGPVLEAQAQARAAEVEVLVGIIAKNKGPLHKDRYPYQLLNPRDGKTRIAFIDTTDLPIKRSLEEMVGQVVRIHGSVRRYKDTGEELILHARLMHE